MLSRVLAGSEGACRREARREALKIGYTDLWRRYDGLEVRRDDYPGNWLRPSAWEFNERLAGLRNRSTVRVGSLRRSWSTRSPAG